jgi:hypothetical protein
MIEDDPYDGVPITKLPPGKAYGAGDMSAWSLNRMRGKFGVGKTKDRATERKRTQALADAAGHPIRSFGGKMVYPHGKAPKGHGKGKRKRRR